LKNANSYLHKVLFNAPAIFCILHGPDHTYDFANELYLQLIGRRNIIGKPVRDVLPELQEQGYFEILDTVYKTGTSYIGNEMLVNFDRGNEKLEDAFFNFSYNAIYDDNDAIEGIHVYAVEVTEQVLSREIIKKSEESYATAVYFSDLGMWDFDVVNSKITTTGKMAEIFGLPSNGSYTVSQALACIYPDDRDEHFRLYRSIETNRINPKFETEFRIIAQDTGKVKWIHAKGMAFFDDQGKVYRTVGKVSDETNRKLVEIELKQYKDLIEEAVNLMPLKITNADADGRVFYYNQNWLDYTGLSKDEIDSHWNKIIHHDELEEFTIRWEQAVATGSDFEMELRFLDSHKQYKWNVMRASPIKDNNGKVIRWIATANEVHEQRKQRAELEHEVIKRTLELKTANAELLFQNEQKEKRAAELYIANKELIYQGAEKEKRARELVIANKELIYQGTEKQKRADELVIANKELIYQGTEKQKRADELVIANKQLVFQNREKGKRANELSNANKELEAFAHIASHDLQEPLRKIQTFIDRVVTNDNQNLSDKGKVYLEWVQDAAVRMRVLVQDLLSFSQVSAGARKFENVDLTLIVDEVIAELDDIIKEKGATIEIIETCSVNVIVFQFRQLLINLISNSVKFSNPSRPPVIQIAGRIVKGTALTKHLSNDITYCHLTFIDNGIGFEPQFKERIFEVFQRLHGKEVYAGTGIGLAIVKKIVDNHHGFINASSELGKGATFEIFIPADSNPLVEIMETKQNRLTRHL
jgi:PAS domain S-box-containing protein